MKMSLYSKNRGKNFRSKFTVGVKGRHFKKWRLKILIIDHIK